VINYIQLQLSYRIKLIYFIFEKDLSPPPQPRPRVTLLLDVLQKEPTNRGTYDLGEDWSLMLQNTVWLMCWPKCFVIEKF